MSPSADPAIPSQISGHTRRTRAPGDRSRARVLERAASLATLDGLDGVSIARLADATGMPKSSVYALFGSKEQLQLETIDTARTSLIAHVVAPALSTTPPGRERLRRLCQGFLDYVEQRVFPGGCFFVGAAADVGGRRGVVRDRVADYQRQWSDLLVQSTREAQSASEVEPDADPNQLAFELGAILTGASLAAVLHDDNTIIDRARKAINSRLDA
jgi:AcrR family transcriptional regulator